MLSDEDRRRTRRRRTLATVALAPLVIASGTIVGVAFWPIWPVTGGHLKPTYWTLDGVDGRELSVHVSLDHAMSWDNDCLGRLDVDETPAHVAITAYRRVNGHHCNRFGCVRVILREPLGDRKLLRTFGPTATNANTAEQVDVDRESAAGGQICPA